MKYAAPLCLSAAIALLSGCSSMKVSSEQTTDFDYSTVKTFEWVLAPKDILDEDDTFINENVQKALNNSLSERGWQQVLDPGQADLWIVYYIKLMEYTEYAGPTDSDESRMTGGFTYNQSKKKWSYKDEKSDLNVYTIEVGTLTLLLYNADSGEKIWQGTLKTRLDRTTPLDQQQKMLRKISKKIMAQIPTD